MRTYAYELHIYARTGLEPGMTRHDQPSTFWAELMGHVQAMHKNESWLARRLGVPLQTLSSWKQRNQFRRSCLQQLVESLHWDGLDEELAAQLGVELIEGRVATKSEAH